MDGPQGLYSEVYGIVFRGMIYSVIVTIVLTLGCRISGRVGISEGVGNFGHIIFNFILNNVDVWV